MSFEDPENWREIINDLPVRGDKLLERISELLPGWIITDAPQFSSELYKFNEQWALSCLTFQQQPQKILLVQDTFIETQLTTHKIIREVIGRLIKAGYVIIDTVNFSKCIRCSEVIVSERRFAEKHLYWNGKCQKCDPRDVREKIHESKESKE